MYFPQFVYAGTFGQIEHVILVGVGGGASSVLFVFVYAGTFGQIEHVILVGVGVSSMYCLYLFMQVHLDR